MKRKALISMFAAMVTLALSMSAVACGISDDEDDSSSEEQHVHVLTAVDATAASCTAEGNKAYYICECGKLFEDADAITETSAETVKIAKLDHAYGNWDVTVKATCTAIGSREKVCSACNNKVTEEIPALGHDEIMHAGQDATCTENGWNAYVTCSRCNYTTYTEIPALGHDYRQVVGIPATYYKEGIAAHYECTRTDCGELFVKNGETYEKTTAEALVTKKLSLIDNATKASTEPENYLHLETDKVKEMNFGGLYSVENVVAYYFYNAAATKNAEARFVTFGTDTIKKVDGSYVFAPQRVRSFSFEYKIVNSCANAVDDVISVSYIVQILGSDGSYDILEFDPALNGEWGSYSYTLTDAQIEKFAGFIVKMGGLTGEMLVANINVDAISLTEGCTTATEPECILGIEEGKTEKMTYGGLYAVDGKTAYYFYTDKSDGFAETRFVSEGTDTKARGSYVFAPLKIKSFSFEYKIRNISKTLITDDEANAPYFSQIICSDGTYYPLKLEMIADGKWHTATFDVPDVRQSLFSGFIVKLGRLKGEMLIADIKAEVVSFVDGCETTTEPDGLLHIEDKKVSGMTFNGIYNVDGKVGYYFTNEDAVKCAEARFVTEGTKTFGSSALRVYKVNPTVTKFSFDYKFINLNKTIAPDELIDSEKSTTIFQILDPEYKLNYAFNAVTNGQWQKFEYTLTSADRIKFAGFIVKMGGLKGQLLIADIKVEQSELAKNYNGVASEPEGLLSIESKTVKNMDYLGTYNIDGKIAYYFTGSGKDAGTRFVTEGTSTVGPSVSRKYNYDKDVTKISFRYKTSDTAEPVGLGEKITGKDDAYKANYIVQILEPSYGHNYELVVEADGEWHDFELVLSESDREVFAGFIVKFGAFIGELLIADIEVTVAR